jgi:hypothetical protein
MSCNTSTSADLRPAQYNVKIWRNDTWGQTFAILANDVAVNLAGSTIVIQVRESASSSTSLLTLSTTTSTITITGASNNQVTLNKVVNIPAGTYTYDMNVTFPSGVVKTYIWGTFIVQEDITKP